tara:strand:- start:1623 stop:2528 length:906 start_codon:yes stop_codon:yes gene_type:complete
LQSIQKGKEGLVGDKTFDFQGVFLRNRIITSIIGIPIIFISIIWNIIGLLILCSIIGLIASYEIYKMLPSKKTITTRDKIIFLSIILLTCLPLIFSIFFINEISTSFGILFSIYVAIVSLSILIFVTFFTYKHESLKSIGFWKFWIYITFIGFGIAHFPLLYSHESKGPSLTIIIIALTFTFDIFALFVGQRFGKTKIFPRISPNKSLEGYIGGFLSLFPMLFLLQMILDIPLSFLTFFIAIITISFSSLFGDLYESYIKRQAKIKDSGSIIPGHGGILDRTDSILSNIIVFYWIVIWLKI